MFVQSEGKKPLGYRKNMLECTLTNVLQAGLGSAERSWHPPSTMSLTIDFT